MPLLNKTKRDGDFSSGGGGFLWHQRRRASKTTHKASVITRLIPLYENHKCFTVIYINHRRVLNIPTTKMVLEGELHHTKFPANFISVRHKFPDVLLK